ncbi:MAG: 6-bladed beta-propeller [Cyclobacteriaceae bacterium]|nr:6-bladed beta-propeller [Cyclobacteriaceae bacterium]
MISRRKFIQNSSLLGLSMTIRPDLSLFQSKDKILGHGDFRYKIDLKWGNLDPDKFPVVNCHEMVMDRKGRMILLTDEPKNNVIVYDQSGKLLETWTLGLQAAHGLTLVDEGDAEYLWISDNGGRVIKTTLNGTVVSELVDPRKEGIYESEMRWTPTETAVAPNGHLYVADGYGSQYFLQYDSDGNFIRKFGGPGFEDHQFSTAHGIAVDQRNGKSPTLICTSRGHNSFKRFSLNGEYMETIFLPGAFVCRPVIHGENLYAGVCWSRLRYLEQTPDSGFVTILDKDNRVVSNPGGSEPEYRDGELQLMKQAEPVFKHCHDVCIDQDENIYVCQWNAGKTYPIKLTRV